MEGEEVMFTSSPIWATPDSSPPPLTPMEQASAWPAGLGQAAGLVLSSCMRREQNLQRRTGRSQSLWDFVKPNSKHILPWRMCSAYISSESTYLFWSAYLFWKHLHLLECLPLLKAPTSSGVPTSSESTYIFWSAYLFWKHLPLLEFLPLLKAPTSSGVPTSSESTYLFWSAHLFWKHLPLLGCLLPTSSGVPTSSEAPTYFETKRFVGVSEKVHNKDKIREGMEISAFS